MAPYSLLRLPLDLHSPLPAVAPRPGVADEELAGLSGGCLLITAPTQGQVEALARRIHGASRGAAPFVQVRAEALPAVRSALRATCVSLLERTRGGSLLLADVEGMGADVQEMMLDVLKEVQAERTRLPAGRLISGTTVSLLDRVRAGTFSERLFYRLNVQHLRVP